MIQTASLPRTPYRPQVKRMSQRELHGIPSNNEFDSSTAASANRWQNRRPSQIPPETYAPWRPTERPPRNIPDDEKNKCFVSRGWLWLFGGIFCLILLIAIVAVVLGIVLPMTTTAAPDSSATRKMVLMDFDLSALIECSDIDHQSIVLLNESIPSGWTSYSYNYSATKIDPTVLFGFKIDAAHRYYLDDVSVINNDGSVVQLLTNPSFENSSIDATNWVKSCETTCAGQIVTGSECFGGSGNCFMTSCSDGNTSILFLGQSFFATIGNTYTISFMLNLVGNSSTEAISFYLDVI